MEQFSATNAYNIAKENLSPEIANRIFEIQNFKDTRVELIKNTVTSKANKGDFSASLILTNAPDNLSYAEKQSILNHLDEYFSKKGFKIRATASRNLIASKYIYEFYVDISWDMGLLDGK